MSNLYRVATMALLGAIVSPHAAPSDQNPILERWVAQARDQHPQGAATSWNAQSARDRLGGARAWMPPSTQALYKSDGVIELSLSQMIPGPGKTSSLVSVRQARIAMALSDSADQIRQIELAVREAAWMEWMAWEKLRVVADQESLAITLFESVRRSQAQGMSTPSEAWLAQSRARQFRVQAEQFRAEANAATAMRESWTGAGDAPMVPPEPSAPDWNDSDLVRASAERSDVRSMDQDASMQQAMSVSMQRSLRPDFMLGGMLMRMNTGMPGWGVMAGMTLPFAPWSSGMASGDAASARSMARVATSRGQAMRRMAKSEVLAHAAKARAAWSNLRELDDSILPGQDAAIRDARARYAQGREMLPMVLAMEDMSRMTRMESIMRRGEYELERSRLLAAAGTGAPAQEGAR